MLPILLSAFLISSAYGAGEFVVLHHPSSLVFSGHETLRESALKEVYAASLGFTAEHFSNWKGFYMVDPFGVAQAIITVYVDGVSDIGQDKGHNFPLQTDIGDAQIYHSLARRIEEHYPDQETNLVKIDLSNGLEDVQKYTLFNDIPSVKPKHTNHKFLSLQIYEDREMLKEITLLDEISEKVEKGAVQKDNIPDVFWFRASALHALTDLYGENSTQTLEAKQLLNEAISRLNTAFSKAYGGYALITVVTSDASHTRRSRSILEAEEPKSDKEQYNLASYYNKNYPVIFNIILWFSIIMLFSLLAICLAIGNMDPGRNSIIYRMTSTRTKKEN